ncbi:N-acetyltransferase [Fulvivirga ulvae]|uniref:GNAT family N-acetyltransferase n=1 Tax=Fulvivirga ulvae TaxID=2904245 RepID=UPI001F42DA12|nr:N-acetyltransferase [Fulvivirga ulvae]UII31941.1 N-acetyltransferase [Fulvivirga ulvae]
MTVNIRQEKESDYTAVFDLIEEAFRTEPMSDHAEHFLVERLRKSQAFIPELSIVAEMDKRVIGHILLTRVTIENEMDKFDSLALAPVSVLPQYQKQGIGGMLIRYAHGKARELGYGSVVLLGHEKYYPKFGYRPAESFGIQLPFDAPGENCMIIELMINSLDGVKGIVEYPEEFYR